MSKKPSKRLTAVFHKDYNHSVSNTFSVCWHGRWCWKYDLSAWSKMSALSKPQLVPVILTSKTWRVQPYSPYRGSLLLKALLCFGPACRKKPDSIHVIEMHLLFVSIGETTEVLVEVIALECRRRRNCLICFLLYWGWHWYTGFHVTVDGVHTLNYSL